MPIRRDLAPLYPPDWPEISHRIRFERAGGCCEVCGQPHLHTVACLPDGRWQWPPKVPLPCHLPRTAGEWRPGCALHTDRWFTRSGAPAPAPSNVEVPRLRWLRVVLTTAHLDHDPANNADANLAALCGRCHLAHDLAYHKAQRRITYRLRRAIGDLFTGLYSPNRAPQRR